MTALNGITADELLSRVAVEVGFPPDIAGWASSEPHFVQMRGLLQTVCEELTLAFPWEFLVREYQVTTVDTDDGDYDLPNDFIHMLDQTGWERGQNVPLFGPLSAQDWTYLLGRDLVSQTIYASFRIKEGKFSIFPQPPPNDLDINFEYQSNGWCDVLGNGTTFVSLITNGGDYILFDRTLVTRALKVAWLIAKGFDSTAAQGSFDQIFNFVTGKDKGAEILSGGRNARTFPYLDSRYNTPDTGYGVP